MAGSESDLSVSGSHPGDTLLTAYLRDAAKREFGSGKAFAKSIGVSPHTFSSWINRDTSPRGSLPRLAEVLETDVEVLEGLGRISLQDVCEIPPAKIQALINENLSNPTPDRNDTGN